LNICHLYVVALNKTICIVTFTGENVQSFSRIYRDQPLTPLEQAVYWTEYVIRQKGAPHLRSAVLDLAWYQYLMLDIIAVLAFVTVCVLVAVYCISRAVISRVFDTMRLITSSVVKKND
jgi:glucuronosyltransferase